MWTKRQNRFAVMNAIAMSRWRMKDKEPTIMVFLDIETTTFFQDEHIKALPRDQQIAAMEFGIAVTIDSREQSPRVWTKDQVIDLYNYLVWCGVEVCGWNTDAFDLPVIINNGKGWLEYVGGRARNNPHARPVCRIASIRDAGMGWVR